MFTKLAAGTCVEVASVCGESGGCAGESRLEF